ncbi:MAG: WG repeat-containing protein [Candidatus Heteroscillospira sp.]|jgi:hypothetical protein
MKFRCACFELCGILENPALAKHISANIRYTIPGFGCDYHLCTFKDDLEFNMCVVSENDKIMPIGIDLHFSSNSVWTAICDSIIDDESTSHEYIVHSVCGAGNQFPVRVICPDVMPRIKPGCEIYGQVVAFGANGKVAKEADVGNTLVAIDGHAVMLNGKITDLHEQTFSFENIIREYYEFEVETTLGSLTVIVLKKNIVGAPEIGDRLSVKCYISMDVAIPPRGNRTNYFSGSNYPQLPGDTGERSYRYGCTRNHKQALMVLEEAAKHKNAIRFGRCCADEVLFIDVDGNERVMDRWGTAGEFGKLFSATHTVEPVLTVSGLSGTKTYLGGILLDGETYVVIGTNEDGLVEYVALLSADQYMSDADTERYLLLILAEALCSGSVNRLHSVMSDTCIYRSDCSGKRLYGLRDIIESIRNVRSNLDETNRYRYELVPASEEIRKDAKSDLPGVMTGDWCFRLWQQNEGGTPVAIVFIQHNDCGQITNILLAHRSAYLNTYAMEASPSVEKSENYAVDVLLNQVFGEVDTISAMRKKDVSAPDEEGVYVWQKADQYIRDWFQNNTYRLDSSELFDDCIGYACTRKGIDYAVYMYAYGKQKSTILDGDYCAKLRGHVLSNSRTILVIYLHVTTEEDECGKTTFFVGGYGSKDTEPEVWNLGWIGSKSAILYYPRKEMIDLGHRFMAAYNSQRLDILKAILADSTTLDFMDASSIMNDAVYSSLSNYFKEYGTMKTAFVRFNDVVYSEVPYIEGLCYVDFSVNQQNKIDHIGFNPLDENYRELIVTDEVLTSHPMDEVPLLEKIAFLPPSERSRFAMLLTFVNGETRRYDVPGEFDEDEVVTWKKNAFTYKMFRNGRIANPVWRNDAMFYRNYPQQHQGVEFINGVSISTVELYHNSYPVGRFHYDDGPEVFKYESNEDDGFAVGTIRDLDPADPLYLFDTRNKVAVTIPEQYQHTPIYCYPSCGGYSEGMVMVSTMGELDLQYHHNRQACAGMWGWLDTELNIVIEPQYVFALNFYGGRALVCKGEWGIKEVDGKTRYWCENEQWGVIDKNGKDIVPCKFDELYEIENTDRLYFVHEGGWDNGHYAVFDIQKQKIILELDFDFDMGYMFNECFVDENDLLVFVNHLPGEGEDLIYVYDLQEKKFIAYADSYTERTFNGQSRVVVQRDGHDIIVF